MTNKYKTSLIDIRFEFFPKSWEPGVARRVLDLLIGPDKLFPATHWGNEGKNKLPKKPDEIIDWLTDRYEYSHKANRIPLFTNKSVSEYNFDLFRSEWDEESTFGKLLHWPKELLLLVPADRFAKLDALKTIAEITAITEAPLVTIDFKTSWEQTSISLASQREMRRVVKGTIHRHAAIGAWRGLHRIPWCLILGKNIVKTIGVEKLQKLPPDQAIEYGNGVWCLQTSIDPADSITATGRDAEQKIIEVLGEQFFADTQRNRLAEVVPEFPAEWIPQDSRLFERYGDQLKPL